MNNLRVCTAFLFLLTSRQPTGPSDRLRAAGFAAPGGSSHFSTFKVQSFCGSVAVVDRVLPGPALFQLHNLALRQGQIGLYGLISAIVRAVSAPPDREAEGPARRGRLVPPRGRSAFDNALRTV